MAGPLRGGAETTPLAGATYTADVAQQFRVVSPHLDDAALSCSRFAVAHPHARFLTVFAGGPARVDPLPPWDRAARFFRDGDDVTAIRREEDRAACEILEAVPEHLDFWDGQYRSAAYGYTGPADAALGAAITLELERLAASDPVDAWLVPLGLGHSDHRLTSDVCLALAQRTDLVTYVYGDLPYCTEREDEVLERLHSLAQRGFALVEETPTEPEASSAHKREAVRAHRSQRRSLGRRARRAVRATERRWALSRTTT